MTDIEASFKEAMNQGHSAAWDQDWESAAQHYHQALQENPDSFKALTSLGLALFNLREYEQALPFYRRAAQVSTADPLPIEKMAEIYEQLGDPAEAVSHSMKAADLYLNIRDAEKSLENWTRVTRIVPGHLPAHTRLAMVHEKMGNNQRAVTEYLAVASLLQQKVKLNEALRTVQHALKIDPERSEAQEALRELKANKTLPLPRRPTIMTGSLVQPEIEVPPRVEIQENGAGETGTDPVTEARQKALTALAALLFDPSTASDGGNGDAEEGFIGFTTGVGSSIIARGPDRAALVKHLGKAVDLQTHGENDKAVEELKRAMDAGLDHPAAFFNRGILLHEAGRQKDAQRDLQHALKHPDYGLAARLLVAEHLREQGSLNEAAEEYLEALKTADVSLVEPDVADNLRELYEPLIEAHSQEEDEVKLEGLCENIYELLMRPNWRSHLRDAREQMPVVAKGAAPMPFAEMIAQASTSEVVEALAQINQLARQGYLRTAMEEAYVVLDFAPAYLPLHISMGDLLMRQERVPEAIEKFTMVANAYSARGEANRATDLFRRIVELSPMDLAARTRLIDQLASRGAIDEALQEYMNLADVYYRLAELDMARNTYETAFRLAEQSQVDEQWAVEILLSIADIDTQRLDWSRAQRAYEKVRSIKPDDELARKRLIDMNVRLGQNNEALLELDNYIAHLTDSGSEARVAAFIEELVAENPTYIFARARLAEVYRRADRLDEAVEQWDEVGEMLIAAGDVEGAKSAVRSIVALNPPNVDQYLKLLQQLG